MSEITIRLPRKYELSDWSELEDQGTAFLQARYETSLFLLGNLESFGSRADESPNSGNYKVVLRDDDVAAAFCLTKRGNLLVQGDSDQPLLEVILKAALTEGVKIGGVLG